MSDKENTDNANVKKLNLDEATVEEVFEFLGDRIDKPSYAVGWLMGLRRAKELYKIKANTSKHYWFLFIFLAIPAAFFFGKYGPEILINFLDI